MAGKSNPVAGDEREKKQKKMGGWSHPGISLEDLIKLVKGFVDILILASGYQSSGQIAHWDPQNIKKAFQWGLFFENVLRHLDDYQDSAEELDVALSELTSNPYFPQGLTELSSATLSRARKFILEHFLHTLPLTDPHLKGLIEATIEMDLDELQKTENNCLHVYLDKLNLQTATLNPGRGLMEDLPFPRLGNAPHGKAEILSHADFTMSTIEEIMKRELAVSCISATETGMNCLTKIVNWCTPSELNNRLILDLQKQATAPVAEEQLLELLTWRTRNLSYLLDNRIMRLVSGASMIFSAPKVQWVQVFERLNMSANTDDDLRDTIELLLVGLIASRWTPLLEHFISVSNDFHVSLTIHTLYLEVHNLFMEKHQNIQSKEKMKSSKEQGVLEFLEGLLSRQLHQLWKLSPILVAMSLPSWSQLFRLYLSELLSQFKGKSPTIRCCSCIEDNKEHKDCELAERLWCIHIFHGHGST